MDSQNEGEEIRNDNGWVEQNKDTKSASSGNGTGDDKKSNGTAEKIKRNLEGKGDDAHIIRNLAGEAANFEFNSNHSSYFTVNKTPNVSCKIHGRSFLMVDTVKFRVQCKKCIDNGEKNKNLEITEEEGASSDDEEEIECNSHSNSKAIFYCDDCKVFLCKLCFANEHRSHRSNLPIDIAKEFKGELKELIDNVAQIKPKIEDSLKGISEIDSKIRSIREYSIKNMKDFIAKIGLILKGKWENTINRFEQIFEGLDIEVENVDKRLASHLKKSTKYITELNEIHSHINNSNFKSSAEICIYKKKKSQIIQEVIKLLDDSKTFIQYKIETTKNKVNSKIDIYKKIVEKFYKQIGIIEKSVLTSINTGISSSSLRVRRFNKFSKRGLKYYKTSSIILKVNSPICLVGFGVCGLYMHHKELYDSNQKESTSVKTAPTSDIHTPMTMKSIPFQISIIEIKNQETKEFDTISTEEHNIKGIVNISDPTFVVYMNKAVNMKPDRSYMVSFTNLHKDSYIEIWCGEVNRHFLKSMVQNITCNSSSIQFEFKPAEGIESDFNEFNQGVVADVLYSYID